MRYLLLIYDNEQVMEGRTPEEMEPIMGEWVSYSDTRQKSGNMLGGDALQPTQTATTVRIAQSKTIISDGPFAETKEQLGGYYMIDAENLDEAVEWASKMTHLPGGGAVEVRPIMDFNAP